MQPKRILIIDDEMDIRDIMRISLSDSGYIVEEAMVEDLYENPKHPYTKALLASLPRMDVDDTALDRRHGYGRSLAAVVIC